jgi:hypothetical protein
MKSIKRFELYLESVNNSDFLSLVRSKFYFYDNKWNFPVGDDIGFYMIERDSNRKLDDLTKEKILKMEDYLNNNNISYDDIDNVFKEIRGII